MFRILVLFACLIALVVGSSGCDVITYPLGRARFAQRGRELADDSFPELGVLEAKVDSVSADLMSFQAMEARLGGQSFGIDPNKSVWVVTVRGQFMFEGAFGGPPTGASQRIFVFDADSGELMQAQVLEGK